MYCHSVRFAGFAMKLFWSKNESFNVIKKTFGEIIKTSEDEIVENEFIVAFSNRWIVDVGGTVFV